MPSDLTVAISYSTAISSDVIQVFLHLPLCVKLLHFTCVLVCSLVCVRACVHVRAFMHQPGNCRCWFVCIQGSACSRSQESFLKATSSSKVSSLNPLSSAKTLSLKTLIFNFSSLNVFSEKKDVCACLILCVYYLGMALRLKDH